MSKKSPLSIRELARETGADRASIAKWIEGITDKDEAMALIRERQNRAPRASNIDPATGLTWFQATQKEHALRLRMENAQRRGELIEVSAVAETVNRAISAIKARILSASNLEQEDKDQILIEVGRLWDEAFGVKPAK